MLNNTFQAVIFANPFDTSDRQVCELAVDNKSLAELFATVKTELTVIVNGEHIVKERFEEVTPKQGDLMIVATLPAGGGDDGAGKQVLRLVATVALMYFTMGAGGLGAGGFFAAGGAIGGGAFAAGAFFIGGTLLLNSMMPMASANVAEQGLPASPSQTYGIDGPKNTSRDGIPVPIVFGQYRIAGNIIASHTENFGRRQMYHGLYNFGEGEVANISDVKINGQPAEEFENTITIRKGTDTQATIPEFSSILTMIPQSISMAGATDVDDNIHTIQTQNEVVRIGLDFTFPQGLYKSIKNGTTGNAELEIALEYRVLGETQESDWTIFQSGVNRTEFDLTGVDFIVAEHSATTEHTGKAFSEIFPLWLRNTDFVQHEVVVGQDGNGVDIVEIQGFDPARFDPATLFATAHQIENVGGDEFLQNRVVTFMLTGTTLDGEVEVIGESYRNGFAREVSTTTKDGNFYLLENENSPFRITVLTPTLPKNRYEIRIARLTPKPDNEDPDRESTTYDTVNLTDVREYKQGTLRYIHTALLGLSVMITDKLNNIPNVTALNHGVNIKTYERDETNTNLYKEIITNSSNPAWICFNLYTNKRWGAAYPESRFILDEFIEWAEFCNENGLQFNGVIDSAMNIWEAIKIVSRVGRAQLLPVGTRVGVNIFKAKTPSQLFNNSNIIESSTSLGWLPLADRANAIDCVFYDEENDNVRREFRYHDTSLLGNGKDNQIRAVQMDLFGVTSHEQAVKECILALNTNKLTQTLSFDTFTNGIAVRKGDVINVQHDMPQWGYGGRVESGTLNSVNLDREVPMTTGKEYAILLSYDALTLGETTGTAINVGSGLKVTSMPPVNTKIVDVTGYGEYKVNHIHEVSPTEFHLLLENASFINGETLSVAFKSTDVLITRDVEVVDGESKTLTLKVGQADFPEVPNALMTFSFGEKTKVTKPFTVTGISGNGIEKRTISAIEYSEDVYNDTLSGALPSFSSNDGTNSHVTNLTISERLSGPSSNLEHIVDVGWDYISTATTKLANVYASFDGGIRYELVAEKAFASAAIKVTDLSVAKVTVKVIALKDDEQEYAQITAPTATIELSLFTNPLPVESVVDYIDGNDLIVSWDEGKNDPSDGDALLRYDVYTFHTPVGSGITPSWKTPVYTSGVITSYTSDYTKEAETFEKTITIPNVLEDNTVYVAIVAVNAIDNAKFSSVVIHSVVTPSVFSSRSGANGVEIWYSSTGTGDPDANPTEWSLTSDVNSTHQAIITWKDYEFSSWFKTTINSVGIKHQGDAAAHPSSPQEGWIYYNTTDFVTYIYQDGAWFGFANKGNPQDDGVAIIYKGAFATPPANPIRNWVYRDTDDNTVYIFDGTAWQPMLSDGIGTDGESVFAIFHSNPANSKPATPTSNYANEGWYGDPVDSTMWLSQKIAADIASGTWGSPIKVGGVDGADAILLSVSANRQVFYVDQDNNAAPAGQVTNFTAHSSGLEGAVAWTTSPVVTLTTSGTNGEFAELTIANFGDRDSVVVTATREGVSDSFTVIRAREGGSAVQGYLTNESHIIACNSAGTPKAGTVAQASGDFIVLRGTENVTANCTFAIKSGGVGLTTPSIDATGTYSIDGITVDSASITFEATYTNPTGEAVSIERTFSVSKAFDGAGGDPGAPGAQWYSGTSNPTSGLGIVNDYYINTSTGEVFKKTSATVWTSQGNIAGDDGDMWHSGTGAPTSGLGTVGDYYLNTTTGEIYEKTGASTWTSRGNIKGPKGDEGNRGVGHYYGVGDIWSDAVANAACPDGTPVIADRVTISNGTTYIETKYWNGTSWIDAGTIIDGNIVINGEAIINSLAANTIKAEQIDVADLFAEDITASGVITAGSGGNRAEITALGFSAYSGGQLMFKSGGLLNGNYLSNSSVKLSSLSQEITDKLDAISGTTPDSGGSRSAEGTFGSTGVLLTLDVITHVSGSPVNISFSGQAASHSSTSAVPGASIRVKRGGVVIYDQPYEGEMEVVKAGTYIGSWEANHAFTDNPANGDYVYTLEVHTVHDWINENGDISFSISEEVVAGTVDTTHSHDWSEIVSKPTTLAGYGITDSVAKTNVTNTFSDYTTFNKTINIVAGAVVNHNTHQSYDKLRVWSSNLYTIGMNSAQSYGWLNDYAMTFTMSNTPARGFLWRDYDDTASDGAMSLTTDGRLMLKSYIGFGNDQSVHLSRSGYYLRATSAHGYIDIGSGNSSWAHFNTDRPNFHFAKGVYVDGAIQVYNTSTYMSSAGIFDNSNRVYSAGNFGKTQIDALGIDASTVGGVSVSNLMTVDDGYLGATAGNFTIGNVSDVPNNPASGVYKRDYVDYTGTSLVFGSKAGSTRTVILETAYNGKIWYHSNTDGNRWTSTQVWTAASDGSGSGLDADLLDGQHGSYYATATHTHNKIQGAAWQTPDLDALASSVPSGTLQYDQYSQSAVGGINTNDNANGVLTVGQHSGGYTAQLSFSSDGNLYYRDNPTTTIGTWRKIAMVSDTQTWTGNNTFSNAINADGGIVQAGHAILNGGTDTWLRTKGAQGWYSQTYGGGIYMEDSTYVQTYQAKKFKVGNTATDAFYTYGGITLGGADNYGRGVTGLYSSSRFQGVFAMGASYQLSADGVSPNNFYGIAWTHSNNPDANGKKIGGHHACFMVNGVTKTAIGDHVWTNGNVTAGGTVKGATGLFLGHIRIHAEHNAGLKFWDSDSYKICMSSQVNSGVTSLYTTADYNMYFKMTGASARGFVFHNPNYGTTAAAQITGDGNIYARGFVKGTDAIGTSDIRVKSDLQPILDAAQKCKTLRTTTHIRSDQDGRRSASVIAQDVEKVLPEAVHYDDDETLGKKLSVSVPAMNVLAIAAVNEHTDEIDLLKRENAVLKTRLANLEAMMEKLING